MYLTFTIGGMPDRADTPGHAPPDSGTPLLGPLVRDAYRWYQDAVRDRLARRDEPALSLNQFEFFARIDWDGTTISELARRMNITRQAAHQTLGELVRTGLVQVAPDPSSARSKLVRPTPHAADRIRVVREVLVEIEGQLAARLGRRKLDQLRDILDTDWGHPRPSVVDIRAHPS
jgi:DNA-binding MarR family transcriptional regulator